MKKITIIALHLGYGGIEKAICSLANMLCDTYQINIISTYKLYDKPVFNLNNNVKVTYLLESTPNKKELLNSIKRLNIFSLIKQMLISARILYLRKYKMIEAIKQIDSDVIISTRIMHNNWLGKYGKKDAIKIAWEHAHHNDSKEYIKKLIYSCSNIDYLIPVSKNLTEFYSKMISSKTKCIYIPLALDIIPEESSSLENKQIISVGRLSKEKGFLDLIDVFKIVNNKRPEWKLNIVGDGLERESIENKIKEEHLENNIIMHGYQNKDKVNELLLNSSIYVMASFTESFGLVLIEAMSYGIQCISFDSTQGSLEIIDDNINGYIISKRDKVAMANKIIELIDNKELRDNLGKKAKEKANLFNMENIKAEWINLINKND